MRPHAPKSLKRLFNPDPEHLNYKPDWKTMTAREKAAYIWEYYKIPIIVALIAIYFLVALIVRFVYRKHTVLYVGSANIAVLDDGTLAALTDDYTAGDPAFGKRDRVSFTYLGDFLNDPDSVPGGRSDISLAKVLATMAADQLDVVLMDRAAFNYFSEAGYLMDLEELPTELMDETISSRLVRNTVVLESNELERAYDPSLPLQEETQIGLFGVDLSGCPLFSGGEVYAGIINQDSRTEESIKYIKYLLSLQEAQGIRETQAAQETQET